MRPRLIGAVTAALVLAPATAALAHPSFNPNAIPAGEAVESVLVVPHGCAPGGGVPDGDGVPTTRFDLGHTEQVGATGRGGTPRWTDAGGATSEPIELPVTITVADGAEGDEIFLPAFQECEDGSSHRWVATPDDAEGDPAVKLELTSGPPATVEVEEDDHGASQAPTGAVTPTTPGSPEPADVASPSPASAVASEESGGTSGIMPVVLVIVAGLVLLGGAVAIRRKKGSA